MEGFTKIDFGGDYKMAAFARKHGCIDNYTSLGNSVTWRGPDGRSVMVAFYDNANCTYTTWVRDDLVPVKRNK